MSQLESQHVSPEMAAIIKQGAPYPPMTAGVGGMPTVSVDVPALSVFLALYLTSAVMNIIIFKTNLRKGHWFFFNGLLVGFSMARVLTCVLRIAWACEPHNVSLAIAAGIFVNVGILIVYIVNLLFAQRIVRARRPEIGWNRWFRIGFFTVYGLIIASLIMLIVMTVDSFFTLDPAIHSYALWIQRSAILYLFLVAATPLILLAIAFLLPPTSDETFGKHSMRTKGIILLAGSCICTTIAGFKVGTLWSDPRAITNPAWYDSKAAFYVFNFTLEIVLLVIYISSRIDHKFHVPNGSSKRKTYRVPDLVESDNETEVPESLSKKDSNLDDERA